MRELLYIHLILQEQTHTRTAHDINLDECDKKMIIEDKWGGAWIRLTTHKHTHTRGADVNAGTVDTNWIVCAFISWMMMTKYIDVSTASQEPVRSKREREREREKDKETSNDTWLLQQPWIRRKGFLVVCLRHYTRTCCCMRRCCATACTYTHTFSSAAPCWHQEMRRKSIVSFRAFM